MAGISAAGVVAALVLVRDDELQQVGDETALA
jgi:hypothetical protein